MLALPEVTTAQVTNGTSFIDVMSSGLTSPWVHIPFRRVVVGTGAVRVGRMVPVHVSAIVPVIPIRVVGRRVDVPGTCEVAGTGTRMPATPASEALDRRTCNEGRQE